VIAVTSTPTFKACQADDGQSLFGQIPEADSKVGQVWGVINEESDFTDPQMFFTHKKSHRTLFLSDDRIFGHC
jgi:hypothetical protein